MVRYKVTAVSRIPTVTGHNGGHKYSIKTMQTGDVADDIIFLHNAVVILYVLCHGPVNYGGIVARNVCGRSLTWLFFHHLRFHHTSAIEIEIYLYDQMMIMKSDHSPSSFNFLRNG